MEEPGGLQSMGTQKVGPAERLHFHFLFILIYIIILQLKQKESICGLRTLRLIIFLVVTIRKPYYQRPVHRAAASLGDAGVQNVRPQSRSTESEWAS